MEDSNLSDDFLNDFNPLTTTTFLSTYSKNLENKDYQLLFLNFSQDIEKMKKENKFEFSLIMKEVSSLLEEIKSKPHENYQAFFDGFDKFISLLQDINPFQYLTQKETIFLSKMAEKYNSINLYHYLVSHSSNLMDSLDSLDTPKKYDFIQLFIENINLNCPENVYSLGEKDSYKSFINSLHEHTDLTQLAYSKKFTVDWRVFNLNLNGQKHPERQYLMVQSNPNIAHKQLMALLEPIKSDVVYIHQIAGILNVFIANQDLFTEVQQREHKKEFINFFNLMNGTSINKIFRDNDDSLEYNFVYKNILNYVTNKSLKDVNYGTEPLFHHLMKNLMTPYSTYYDYQNNKECNSSESSNTKLFFYNGHFNRALHAYIKFNEGNAFPNLIDNQGVSISPFKAFINNFKVMFKTYDQMVPHRLVLPINNFEYVIQAIVKNNISFFIQDNAELYESINSLTEENDKVYLKNFINNELKNQNKPLIDWDLKKNQKNIEKEQTKNVKMGAFKRLFSMFSSKAKEEKTENETHFIELSALESTEQSFQKMNEFLESNKLNPIITQEVGEFFKNSLAILNLCKELPNQFIEEQINVKGMAQKYIFDIVNNYQEGVKIIQNKEKFLDSTLGQIKILNEEISTIYSQVQEKIDQDVQQKTEELGEFLQKRYKSNSM